MFEVYSRNTTLSTVTNNVVGTVDLLNSSDLDNHFSTSKNNNQLNSSMINPP
jgi:hypothetical protein